MHNLHFGTQQALFTYCPLTDIAFYEHKRECDECTQLTRLSSHSFFIAHCILTDSDDGCSEMQVFFLSSLHFTVWVSSGVMSHTRLPQLIKAWMISKSTTLRDNNRWFPLTFNCIISHDRRECFKSSLFPSPRRVSLHNFKDSKIAAFST